MAISCYTPQYLQASFGGVPFVAVEVSSDHGRRGAEGEFPFGENTAYADMGRKIRHYSLSGRFQENNHIAQAEALIAACETIGPKVLVHPTRGIVSAACVSLKISDDIENGQGITKIDMQLVEGNVWPNGLQLTGTFVTLGVTSLLTATRAAFVSNYNIAGSSRVHKDATRATASTQVSSIAEEYNIAIRGTTENTKWRSLSELQQIAAGTDTLEDVDLMNKAITYGIPATAAEHTPARAFDALRRIANRAALTPTLPGIAGETQAALWSNVRVTAAIEMAKASLSEQFFNVSEALAKLDIVTALIEDEIAYARSICENTLQVELYNFMADYQAAMYEYAYTFPRILDFNFSASTHPLSAAYSIYGDAKRHREIELGNIINLNGRVGPVVSAAT